MNYSQSLHYLDSFLNLERITFRPDNALWNLDRMRLLLQAFDRPEKSFFPVLIAGTKGKGSTGFFLESILKKAGIRTGFYSSPHLENARERIRIQADNISEKDWAAALTLIRKVLKRIKLPLKLGSFTYFEILTLMAVLVFKEKGIQVGIFEVGLGGRLDATNALGAKVVILTPIHLDHEAVLGNTITRIAAEKAAVIHAGAKVILSPQSKDAQKVIEARVYAQKGRLYKVLEEYRGVSGLKGDFQRMNAGVAARAAGVLRKQGFCIPDSAIQSGLQASDWPGRMELFPGALGQRADLLLDGAHNPASICALARNLNSFVQRGSYSLLIFGTSRDKNSAEMLKILAAKFRRVILCRIPGPRSQEVSILISQARPWFSEIYPTSSVPEALALAVKLIGQKDRVVVTGSFYLIGEVRKRIKNA